MSWFWLRIDQGIIFNVNCSYPTVMVLEGLVHSLLYTPKSSGSRLNKCLIYFSTSRQGDFSVQIWFLKRCVHSLIATLIEAIVHWFCLFLFFFFQAQFRFCHQVLADYLNSVDNYANFKDL